MVFILDSSASIWRPHFRAQLDFVDGIVSTFNIGKTNKSTQVGIVTFAQGVYKQFDLNRYSNIASLKTAIKRIRHRAGRMTNTGDAIKFMADRMFVPHRGSRTGVPKLAIVITDGQSQKFSKTIMAAANAKSKGIEMFAIGVGDKVKTSELEGIASDPDSTHVFTVENYEILRNRTNFFATKTCKG